MIEKYRIANDNSLVEVEIFYEAIVQYKGIIDHWCVSKLVLINLKINFLIFLIPKIIFYFSVIEFYA